MAATAQNTVRMRRELMRLATERASQEQPDVKIASPSGVIRYAVALLAGLPKDQAARELARGYRMEDA